MARRVRIVSFGLLAVVVAAGAIVGWRIAAAANLAKQNEAAKIAAERDDVLAVYRAAARFYECDRQWKQLTANDIAREKNLLAQLRAGLSKDGAVNARIADVEAKADEDIKSGYAECTRFQNQATAATAILNQQFPGLQEQIERHEMATLAHLGITAADLRKVGVSESEIARSFAGTGGGG